LLVLAVLALVACTSRQQINPDVWNPYAAGPPRDENFRGGPPAILRAYDANKDGVVARDELQSGLRAQFAAADSAKTSCLSNDQVLDLNQKRIEADQSTATPLQDWNQDGCVDYREFATAPASLFEQFDRDRDGRVTAQELDPRAGRGGRGIPQVLPNSGGRGGRLPQ
jgi:hypothetical protein